MRALALPLRLERDGQLARTDRVEALLQLMRAMAATTRGAWAHAPWFGLHELVLEARLEREDQHALTDGFNRAFTALGIDWATVHEVKTAAGREPGERRFDITLLVEGQPVFGQVGGGEG